MASPGSIVSLPVGADAMPLPWATVANSRAVLVGAWTVVTLGVTLAAVAFGADRGHETQAAEFVESPPPFDDCVAFKGASALQSFSLWDAVGAHAVEVLGCVETYDGSYDGLNDDDDDDDDDNGGGFFSDTDADTDTDADADADADGHRETNVGYPCKGDHLCDRTCEDCNYRLRQLDPKGNNTRTRAGGRDLLADPSRGVVLRWNNVYASSVNGKESATTMTLEMRLVRGRPAVLRGFDEDTGAPVDVSALSQCSAKTIPLGYGQVNRLDDLEGLVVVMDKEGPRVSFGDMMTSEAGAVGDRNEYFQQAMRLSAVFGTAVPEKSTQRNVEENYPDPGCWEASMVSTDATLLQFDALCGAGDNGDAPDELCEIDADEAGSDRALCSMTDDNFLYDGIPVVLRLGVFDRDRLWGAVRDNLGHALCARVARPSVLQSLSVGLSIFLTVLGLVPLVVRLIVRPLNGDAASKDPSDGAYMEMSS